ncbi:MAG: hypothetical protein AB1758_26190, partial [Candidatus Eremiobacterota bacterium]
MPQDRVDLGQARDEPSRAPASELRGQPARPEPEPEPGTQTEVPATSLDDQRAEGMWRVARAEWLRTQEAPEVPAGDPGMARAEWPRTQAEAPAPGSAGSLPRTLWNEQAVNLIRDRGVEQGGLSTAEVERHRQLAGQAATNPVAPDALADAVRASGIPLERLEAGQLNAASSYVNGAATPAERQERLARSLDTFTVLGRIGVPRLTGDETRELLWGAARIPGHALSGMDEARLSRTLQEVAGALGSPGERQLQVGKHRVSLSVDPDGQVTRSSAKKGGFLSQLGGLVKKALPVAALATAVIPGVGPLVAA